MSADEEEPPILEVWLDRAWVWICPECETENFEHSEKLEMSEDDQDDLRRRFYDLEPWQELTEDHEVIELYTAPEEVVCMCCQFAYHVENQ